MVDYRGILDAVRRHLIEQFRRLRWPRIRWRIHSFQLAIGSQSG